MNPSNSTWTVCAVCFRPFAALQERLMVPCDQLAIKELDFVGFDSHAQSLRFHEGSDVGDAAAMLTIDESLVREVRVAGSVPAEGQAVELDLCVARSGGVTVLRGTSDARDEGVVVEAITRAFAAQIVLLAREGLATIERPEDVHVVGAVEQSILRLHFGADVPRELAAVKTVIGLETWHQLFPGKDA